MDNKTYAHIIWDWNGTLLDDLNLCLEIINNLLSKNHLPAVSRDNYLAIFGFPVQDYYQNIGFDFEKESFEFVSTEFISAYEKGRPNCLLMSGAQETLEWFLSSGYTQSILSASKQAYLNKAVLDYGIKDYFISINGLDNHHAAGKFDLAKEFMIDQDLAPNTILLIGDTLHDAEIAASLGVDCWLIPNGHQGRQRLESAGVPILDSLSDLSIHIHKQGRTQ
jgi:phosphoglycolate phosphatase